MTVNTYPRIVVGGITVEVGVIAGAGAGNTGGPGGGRPPPTGLKNSQCILPLIPHECSSTY